MSGKVIPFPVSDPLPFGAMTPEQMCRAESLRKIAEWLADNYGEIDSYDEALAWLIDRLMQPHIRATPGEAERAAIEAFWTVRGIG